MNIATAITLKGYANGLNLDYVPANGELVFVKETNFLKIGDGKTAVRDLPYISTAKADIELVPDYVISSEAKEFIKNNKDLIAKNFFDDLYDKLLPNPPLMREVTKALLHADINPKNHLYRIPSAISDLLNDPLHSSEWTVLDAGAYTKSEIDAKLHDVTEEFMKKMYNAAGIARLRTIKTGDNQLCR